MELTVSPSGAVSGKVVGQGAIYGVYRDDRIEISGTRYDLEKKGSGFILTQHDNPDNVIV